MLLPEICIKRPVLATVLSLVILLIGLISYTRLSVREYPRIDEPVVSVDTTYRGASAEVVESQVTKPLEDSLAGIEGVELMTSQSRSERSLINVRFTLKRDPDSAAADVRDKVSRARGKLPDTIDEPIIAKVEADSNPVIYIAVEAGSLSPLDASDYVKRYVQPRLSVLPGAADVRVFGERQVSMRINLDRTRLAGYKLTVQDVEDAIRRQNAEIPAGRIESTRANSPSSPKPTCARRSSSTTSSSPTSPAIRCASATSAAPRSAPSTSGRSRATTASHRSTSA
jgi:Cation/multidrug efflux pump